MPPSLKPRTAAPAAHADTTAAGRFDLAGFLPYRLAVAAEAVSSSLATVYAEQFDLTIPEWRLLANLGWHGTLTAGEAAARSTLDKVQVARAMKRLVARGFVRRRVDGADRRRVFLSLTATGERMRSDIAARAVAWERDLLDGLPPRDRESLERAFEAITARALALKPPT